MSTTTPTAETDLRWLVKSFSETDATLFQRAVRFNRLVTTRGMSAPSIALHLAANGTTPPSAKQISFYLRVLRALTTGGRITTDEEYGSLFTSMNRMNAEQRARVEQEIKAGKTSADAVTTANALTTGATTTAPEKETVTPGNEKPATLAVTDVASALTAFGAIEAVVATFTTKDQDRFWSSVGRKAARRLTKAA